MNKEERYINGYLQGDSDWQSAHVKGDQQLSALNVFLSTLFDSLDDHSVVIDVGMGSGVIAKNLVNFPEFTTSQMRYLGVDLSLNSNSLKVAGIDTSFIEIDKAEFCIFKDLHKRVDKYKENIIVVIVRNVLHEMDVESLGYLFHCLNQIKNIQHILLQDMEQLPCAEFGNAPWLVSHVHKLLELMNYSNIKFLQEESRSGTLWYTMRASKQIKSKLSLSDLILQLTDFRKEQLARIYDESNKLDFSDLKSRLKLLQNQNDSFSISLDIDRAQAKICEVKNNNSKKYTVVSWDEIVFATKNFVSINKIKYDLILGIARGGIPIAILLNNLIEGSKFSVLQKSYLKADTVPFFIFDGDNPSRSKREKLIDAFAFPNFNDEVKNVLIVDDVTTFGNTLDWAKKILHERLGKNINIKYFTFAADINRISVSNPDIVDALYTSKNIDNFNEWMVFPWESMLLK
jgi:hypoxanthine phosphoribosyltransferase